MFLHLSDSVHRGRCTPLDRHPPKQTPLWADTLPGQTPSLGRHPTWTDTHPPLDGHCSGRYASYWNAFLSLIITFSTLLYSNIGYWPNVEHFYLVYTYFPGIPNTKHIYALFYKDKTQIDNCTESFHLMGRSVSDARVIIGSTIFDKKSREHEPTVLYCS